MRLFRALCVVLGALLSVATLPLGSYAADALTLSEAFVLTKDGQLVDTLTITDTSGVMTDSVCTPYEGNSTDHRVEFVVRNGVSICHMQLMYTRAEDESEFTINDTGEYVLTARTDHTLTEYRKTSGIPSRRHLYRSASRGTCCLRLLVLPVLRWLTKTGRSPLSRGIVPYLTSSQSEGRWPPAVTAPVQARPTH